MSCLLLSCHTSTFYDLNDNICISAALLQQTFNYKHRQLCVEPEWRLNNMDRLLLMGNSQQRSRVGRIKLSTEHIKQTVTPETLWLSLLILTTLFTLNTYCHSTFKYGLRSDVRLYVSDVVMQGRAVGHALKLSKCLFVEGEVGRW